MKKNIIILSILFLIQIESYGQDQNSKHFWTNSRIELLGSYELFGGGIGFIAKGKKEIFNLKHFEGFAGLAFQYSYQSETNKLLTGIKGHNSDVGMYTVFDIILYPFKTKKVFTGLEPYLGLTTLKSDGVLEIPKHNIYEDYSNSYTYLNYGITQTIGYSFKRINTSLFAMLSLKGILDKGRTRPGDSDSKIFFGFNISYKLKPTK
ncbi:hypothetical protein [Aquimarina muelleri]|uniref:Uncharacterized protein n=1 Tax=Aquimarina muelleri TaxID=279356 RepID=A0A918JUG0_9FLAO|nr:hypothetical protein [Aquimarina muelleri]MCX2764012.1 hypothetical protein [Aquimarina muelleri]GGX12162.1 hypothetical protein GCM10007384_12400 [Aquimarina muelleri]